ncbi:phage tail spike protein [Eubacterium multiforme]|uniref:Phage minor structural protein n=1 Tax=Eubacterium multiforme TaxID=83339 RepID=A0ABT9US23_9FIRM|nr:phage tail spike protein [Eubacterium multiforme]MDQ0149117.1 phage minor structural protein [Eubacterium multiforme]
MIHLLNSNKKKIAGLKNYKDLYIESLLESGDKTLSFLYPKNEKYYSDILTESYILTKTDEFIVKEINPSGEYTQFICKLNVEDLEGKEWDRFISEEQSITYALNLALVGTGWSVKENSIKKKRTVRKSRCSSWDIIQEIKKIYRVDIIFDTVNKKIEVYEHLGSYKGTYFIENLNLKSIDIQENTNDYYTRIIPIGKDGLNIESINEGKKYLENYQYTNKVKTFYWIDERYTVKESLKEDAFAKLNEISKPYRSYGVETINLAKMNKKYKNILDYSLGDDIDLISKKNRIKEKQRIVKIIEYPDEHHRDRCDLANTVLKFEDLQHQFQETSDTVDNITTDNGTIDGSTIDSIEVKQIENFEANVIKVAKLKAILAELENLNVNKADIQNLNVIIARIGTLEVTKASMSELNAIQAIIKEIKAGKADLTELNTAVAKVGILENKTAILENALAGNLTANNFKANAITAGSAIIAEGAIGSSQISSLSVNKLDAGDIITSKHKIISADGTIEIVGNQILVNRNNINRIVLGEYRKQDGTADYGLLVRAKDGQTVMIDGNGVHNAGITDGAINNNKVADNANISGNKLDINSVIREVNGATETIKGTRVQIGDRTLDIELSRQNNTITEHSKELSNQKATMIALDNAIKLKVDNQIFKEAKDSLNASILENLNKANDYTNVQINSVNTNLSKHAAELNILEKEIKLKVGQSDIDKSVKEINSSILSNSKETNEKINTVSSELKQVKDNFLISINSLNSKTSTIESNIKVVKEYLSVKIDKSKQDAINQSLQNTNSSLVEAKTYADNVSKENTTIVEKELEKAKTDLKKYSDEVAIAKAKLAQENAIANTDNKITIEEQARIKQAQDNLNNALAKVEEVKTYTNKIIEVTKQEVIADSTNKTNELSTEINSKISTIKGEILKNESNLNQAKIDLKKYSDDVSIAKANLVIEQVKAYADGIVTKEEQARIKQATDNLNIAVTKVNQAKSDAQSYAENIATSKANLAKAYADEVSIAKSNLAKTQAQSYADGIVTKEEQSRIKQANDNLNTAIAKATDAETKAKAYADSVTDTAKAETNKYINGKVKEVNNVVTANTSAINILKTEVSSKVNKTDIDTLTRTLNGKIIETTSKINTVESNFVQKNNQIGATVNDIKRIVSTKADGSTISSIQSQIASFNVGLNAIKLEMANKTDKTNIISTINLTPGSFKIESSKINIDGATTLGDENKKHIFINKGNYSIINEKNVENAYLGYVSWSSDNVKDAPRLGLAPNGFNGNSNYFVMTAFRKGQNPQDTGDYLDMAYRVNRYNDYSNIKMYDNGDIRIAALRDLEITTNSVSNKYEDGNERRLAVFSTSSASAFNSYLAVGCVRNFDNGNGLILADDKPNRAGIRIQVSTDSSNDKYFRSLSDGDVLLGSPSFRWYRGYFKYAPNISSHRHLKTNISKYNDIQAYEGIKNINLYTFNLKKFDKNGNVIGYDTEVSFGSMIDELPMLCCDTNDTNLIKTGVDMYGYTSYAISALKIAIDKIEKLEKEIEDLKKTS